MINWMQYVPFLEFMVWMGLVALCVRLSVYIVDCAICVAQRFRKRQHGATDEVTPRREMKRQLDEFRKRNG